MAKKIIKNQVPQTGKINPKAFTIEAEESKAGYPVFSFAHVNMICQIQSAPMKSQPDTKPTLNGFIPFSVFYKDKPHVPCQTK